MISNKFAKQLILLILIFPLNTLSVGPTRQLINFVLSAKPSMRERVFLRNTTEEYIIAMTKSRAERNLRAQHLEIITPILMLAIEKLHEISGFDETLHVLLDTLDQPTCAGHLFEIEKALEIMLAQSSEKLLYMNRKIEDPEYNIGVFVDIITSERIIECKNIAWNKKPDMPNPITSKLVNQFLTQQEVVKRINRNSETHHAYEVHSKRPVPLVWQNWFDVHKITIVKEKN